MGLYLIFIFYLSAFSSLLWPTTLGKYSDARLTQDGVGGGGGGRNGVFMDVMCIIRGTYIKISSYCMYDTCTQDIKYGGNIISHFRVVNYVYDIHTPFKWSSISPNPPTIAIGRIGLTDGGEAISFISLAKSLNSFLAAPFSASPSDIWDQCSIVHRAQKMRKKFPTDLPPPLPPF